MADLARCARCGKGIADGQEKYCSDCAADVRGKSVKGRWFLAGTVVFLLLVGVLYAYGELNPLDFSWDALLGRPAVMVNGEPVARSMARRRIAIGRRMLEREYGRNLFTGERGRAYLAELERDILEKMVEERLVAQEARRLNITVSDAAVEKEMQRIGCEVYGSWEKCQASLRGDGISPEDLADHVRNLLLFQEVNKVKTSSGANSDRNAAPWLVQARRDAVINLNKAVALRRAGFLGAGCCSSAGSGGGCGLPPSAAEPVSTDLEVKVSAAALAEYRKTNPSVEGLKTRVTDYGCHIQVDIEQGKKVLKSYAYQDGQVTEN